MRYVPQRMLEEWQRRDPIERYARRLREDLGFAEDEIEAVRDGVREYVARCAEKALASPMPDPSLAMDGVFAESWEPLGDGQAPWSRYAHEVVR